MNASCALQHFCDIHGPQILLCTEGRIYVHDLNDQDNEVLKTFYSQYIKSDKLQEKTECKSCTLSSDGIHISSIDVKNHMLYISSPSTPNRELFKNIRNACVRSLNIEKSTDNDHPILFGDDENGYCLALAFSCKDFHARGSQRLYSICYLCHDKYHLLSLMTLISECLKQIVYWLQCDANKTYEHEGRIKINTNLNETTTATYIYRPPPRTPSQRMFSDIVNDQKLIYRIHSLFVWILRKTNSLINESLFDALPTEEQTTKEERKDNCDSENPRKHRSRTLIESLTNGNKTFLNYVNDDDDDDDDFDSLEYQFSSYGYEALQLFKQFIQKLNNLIHLQFILFNWTIGNQLIINYTDRTGNKDFIRKFTSVFRLFLPDGCCRLIETTNQVAPCIANLILFNTSSVRTNPIEEELDYNSIPVEIFLDYIDDHIQEAKLESLPPFKSDLIIPTYVKTIIDLLNDNNIDGQTFEAIITQQKIKYLNKAKLYFQLGRCQVASTLTFNEHQQMDLLNINNRNDLLIIRFWQKGLSENYKAQIRMLKQNENQQQLQKK